MGLNIFHSQKVVHRDIKPANVLFSIKTQILDNLRYRGEVIFKWADFGLSKSNVTERGSFSQSQSGSWKWMPPEVFNLIIDNSGKNEPLRETVKSDVYSEGLVFGFCMLDGVHLLGQNFDEINTNRQTGNVKNATSKTSPLERNEMLKSFAFYDVQR